VTLKPGLGVTQGHRTNKDWSDTYDFLLTFHIVTISLYRTVSEINGDLSQKLQIFSTPCILRHRWRGSPWIWVSAQGVKKLKWWCYQMVQKVLR